MTESDLIALLQNNLTISVVLSPHPRMDPQTHSVIQTRVVYGNTVICTSEDNVDDYAILNHVRMGG